MSDYIGPITRCELVPDGLVHSQHMPFAVPPCGSLSPEAKCINVEINIHQGKFMDTSLGAQLFLHSLMCAHGTHHLLCYLTLVS